MGKTEDSKNNMERGDNRTRHLDYKVLARKLEMPVQRMKRRVGHFEKVLGDTEVKDKRILEIGAGAGLASCFLAMKGAESVIALEPEAAGSENDTKAKFTRNIKALDLTNVSLVTETLQDYDAPTSSFDLVIALAVINHLDEDACMCLDKDAKAVERYQELFEKILVLLKDDGQIIFTDCSRKNSFFWLSNKLGIPNPSAPMIDWYRHQEPKLWAEILRRAGFKNVNTKWIFPTWRIPGVINCEAINKLLDNFVLAYLTTSYFGIIAYCAD